MHRSTTHPAALIVFFVLATVAGVPGFGHCGDGGPGVAASAEQDITLQAQDVVSVLNGGDVARLLALLGRYPRLPEAILTVEGVTTLGYAAATGNTAALQALLRVQPPLDGQDRLRRTALYLALANAREDTALQLVAAGANVGLPDEDGISPLHLAAKHGLSTVASALLERGGDLEARSARGTTPLAVAAYFGHLPVVRLLVEHGANVNSADADGVTPLHSATQSKNPDVVRYLVGKGARRGAKDRGGKIPADWARQAGDREMESLLAER